MLGKYVTVSSVLFFAAACFGVTPLAPTNWVLVPVLGGILLVGIAFCMALLRYVSR